MSSTQGFNYFDFSKLILGAAQFGNNYGVSNLIGETHEAEVKKIIAIAEKNNIKLVDTSSAYGSSEEKIGNTNSVQISAITKMPYLPADINEYQIEDWVYSNVDLSSKRLQTKKLHTILIHKASDLQSKYGKIMYKCLLDLKKENKLGNIGYSVYNTEEIDQIYIDCKPDVVQIPMNILDNRFNSSGWTEKMKKDGVQIHARSVFLQGLLLMNASQRPKYFNKWKKFWKSWDEYIKESKLSPLSICLKYMLRQIKEKNVSHFIVGVNQSNHLEKIIKEINSIEDLDIDSFELNDTNLINPNLWKIK